MRKTVERRCFINTGITASSLVPDENTYLSAQLGECRLLWGHNQLIETPMGGVARGFVSVCVVVWLCVCVCVRVCVCVCECRQQGNTQGGKATNHHQNRTAQSRLQGSPDGDG